MFKTVTVQVKNKVKTVKVFVKPTVSQKAVVETYIANKFARIDPNHKILGVK